MAVRSVSFTATAASAVDAEILTIVSTLIGARLDIKTEDKTSLVQHTINKFLGDVPEMRAASLTGCLRLLLSGTELEMTPSIESWVWAAEETVLGTIRKGEWFANAGFPRFI